MTHRLSGLCVAASILLLPPSAAWAGPFGDALAQCTVKNTSEADRTLLVKWVLLAMSAHPDVAAAFPTADAQRTEVSKDVARIIERLFTEACAAETRQAMLNEGIDGLKAGFRTLSQSTVANLMSHPSVTGVLTDFSNHLDVEKLDRVIAPDK